MTVVLYFQTRPQIAWGGLLERVKPMIVGRISGFGSGQKPKGAISGRLIYLNAYRRHEVKFWLAMRAGADW